MPDDLNNDVLNFSNIFDLRFEDKDKEPIEFNQTARLIEWTVMYLKFNINFTSPLSVSHGDRKDKVYLDMKE